MNELMEKKQKVIAVTRAKRGLISTVISIALIVVAVIVVQRAWNYSKLEKENKKLQASLSESESKLEKLNETQAQLTHSNEECESTG